MMFLPVLPLLAAITLVYAGTHPAPPPALSDPSSQGLYYDPVSIISQDGTRLSGWLVPAIDAHRVATQREAALSERRPALVLVHDFGQSPQQMLPLLGPLHDEGYVLLAVCLRGDGIDHTVGQTFGVSESLDVKAAVELLSPPAICGPTADWIARNRHRRQRLCDDRAGPGHRRDGLLYGSAKSR